MGSVSRAALRRPVSDYGGALRRHRRRDPRHWPAAIQVPSPFRRPRRALRITGGADPARFRYSRARRPGVGSERLAPRPRQPRSGAAVVVRQERSEQPHRAASRTALGDRRGVLMAAAKRGPALRLLSGLGTLLSVVGLTALFGIGFTA